MTSKINVLYISTLCSERQISYILSSKLGMPNLAAQKYHRLLVQGMVLNTDLYDVQVISIPDYSKGNIIIFDNPEIEKDVSYTYAPIVLLPILKHLIVAIFLTIKIIKWKFKHKGRYNLMVFDILNLSSSIICTLTSKIFGIKSMAVVTDLPELMYVLKDSMSVKDKVSYKVKNFLLHQSSFYVGLSEGIIKKINRKNKPFIIIEGLADLNSSDIRKNWQIKLQRRIIHYSGGLYEKFGVKSLIEAFMLMGDETLHLHLYGNGDLVNFINTCVAKDPRIIFFGYKDNKEVINDQLNAYVLVNPRFTKEAYTKYSFPSKTIEYMSSGTPLLTTRLPGIPKEYLDYLYLINEESVLGIKEALIFVLDKPVQEISAFGERTRNFVLINKNNKLQAKRLYDKLILEEW